MLLPRAKIAKEYDKNRRDVAIYEIHLWPSNEYVGHLEAIWS